MPLGGPAFALAMDEFTLSKVFAAIKEGQVHQLERLLEKPQHHSVFTNFWDVHHIGRKSVLHWAAMHESDQQGKVVEILLRKKADLTLTDHLGRNVGHEAAEVLNWPVLDVLSRQDHNILRNMLRTADSERMLPVEYVSWGFPDDEPDESQEVRRWMLHPAVFSDAAFYLSESIQVLIDGWAEDAEVYETVALKVAPPIHLRRRDETEIMHFVGLMAFVRTLLRNQDQLDATAAVDFYHAVHILLAILDQHR